MSIIDTEVLFSQRKSVYTVDLDELSSNLSEAWELARGNTRGIQEKQKVQHDKKKSESVSWYKTYLGNFKARIARSCIHPYHVPRDRIRPCYPE